GGSAWKGHRSTDNSYPGDNRLISPKSSHRRVGLAPRCRLIASWGCSRSQGLGCSPIKAVRELGSERRETVRSLSVVGVWKFERSCPSYESTGIDTPLVYQLFRQEHSWGASCGTDQGCKHLRTRL